MRLRFIIFTIYLGDNVMQTNPNLEVDDGAEATFHCKFETLAITPDLFWYFQEPRRSPRAIIHRAAYVRNVKEPGTRYESKLDTEGNSIYLKISDVRVSDSGVYFCALKPTVSVTADCSVQKQE
uniref:Ig-like domain-containing protein n=1 Tax=Leptobrachium leishanense TaxID=445787 RepID=A0A8C5M773_9ANUR